MRQPFFHVRDVANYYSFNYWPSTMALLYTTIAVRLDA